MTPTLGQRILGTLALILGVIVTLIAIILALVIVPVVLIVTTVVLIVARFFGLGDFTMIRRSTHATRRGDGRDVLTLCPSCGRVSEDPASATCSYCGNPLDQPLTPQTPPTASPSTPAASGEYPTRRLPAGSSAEH